MIQFQENAWMEGRTEGWTEGQTEGRTDPIRPFQLSLGVQKEDSTLAKNYKPARATPCVSEVFERIIQKQL